MVEVQAGEGFGMKKFRPVWEFDTPETFDSFARLGWELGRSTSAVAGPGGGRGDRGRVSVVPGVWLYHLTGDRRVLPVTKGTKYYRDDDLNGPSGRTGVNISREFEHEV